MLLTATGIGAALFIVALIFMRRHKAPRLQAWLMLLAGACLTSGLLGSLIAWATGAMTSVGGTASQVALGVAAPGLIALALGLVLLIDMHPKKGSPKRWTPWGALLLLPLIAATWGGAAAMLPERVREIVAQAAASMGQVLGDLFSQM